MRRLTGWAVVAVLVVAASVVLIASGDKADGDPAQALSASLSCPSCAGQSVAESNSPVAAGMRRTIADQLAAGRSPDEVRDWFITRYGADIVRSGSGSADPLLWVLPLVLIACLVAATAISLRRRSDGRGEATASLPSAARSRPVLLAVSGLVVLVVVGVAGGSWWIERKTVPAPRAADDASPLVTAEQLETDGDLLGAADAYRLAADQDPDPAIRLRQAFALLRAGRSADAVATASPVQAARPDDPNALLILGLAQRAAALPAAPNTLARFLAVAPDHPAAQEVRRLLGDRAAQPQSEK